MTSHRSIPKIFQETARRQEIFSFFFVMALAGWQSFAFAEELCEKRRRLRDVDDEVASTPSPESSHVL
ncbi:hypothetical protein A6U87_20605 [Rhizobium sp. AC44/96]|nr:hypothetical protein A6U87_20605 [Rhizobium sp. AC44/96]